MVDKNPLFTYTVKVCKKIIIQGKVLVARTLNKTLVLLDTISEIYLLINSTNMTVVTENMEPKPATYKRSRLEINIRLLLNKCELIAKQEAVDGNWRLKKYVESLNEMLTDLKNGRDKPPKDVIMEYTKRVGFLKGLLQTATLNTPTEKLEALQQLSHGAATMCADAAAQEIHQKTVAKYGNELRSDLFGLDDTDDSLRKRNIIKAPNFTSTSTSQEDIDTLLKYHQNMQEKVAEDMVMLTKSLKEQSQIASTIIRRDTEALKKSSTLTDRNVDSLKVESSRLQEHSRGAWKCWLWLMLAVVMVIFINMVLFMKVMKKRKYESV